MYRLSAKLLVTIYGLSEGGQSAILPGAETIRGYGVAVSFVPPARRRVLPPSMPQGVDLETEVALPGRAGQVGQCVTAYVGVEPHAQIAPGVAGPVGGVLCKAEAAGGSRLKTDWRVLCQRQVICQMFD